MAAFNIQLQGFPAANRDATVRLINQVTGTVVERKPFLDGSLILRDLDPGPYEIAVMHPNLTLPIDRRTVRLFPQPAPTFVPIPVPADLFRDTPIRDLPDADLAPIQQAATSVRDRMRPIANKAPGEVIRASDWNTLAAAMGDLASAVMELTQLVSPRGHNHPEIEEKIGEVQGNLRRFAEAFGRSLVELRREIETESLRDKASAVLDLAGASEDLRTRVFERVADLEDKVQSDTTVFTGRLAGAGSILLNAVNEMAVAQGANADTFLANPDVQKLTGIARQYVETGTQTRPESELLTYQKTTTAGGGSKFSNLVRR
ncbi:MAG TPA: hypothetical protein VJB57_15600 [Dehalococcoidia bacterium]|nr:hypothetical protein [Dehalococcoidia bacterium]